MASRARLLLRQSGVDLGELRLLNPPPADVDEAMRKRLSFFARLQEWFDVR